MRKYIFILLFALIGSASCFAQEKIDKVINMLEKKSDVETTYTERRSPKKKKLYRISRILTFSNNSYYESLVKAFEEERENTITAVKNRESMTYRFENDKGSSSYTLSYKTLPYTLVMSWTSADASKLESYEGSKGQDNNITYYIIEDESGTHTYFVGNNVYSEDLSRQAAEAREQAAEAREQAAKARTEALKQAAKAREQAAKAREQAAKARKNALEQAAKARQDAYKQAAKARNEAAKVRRDAYKQASKAGRDALEQARKARKEAYDKAQKQIKEKNTFVAYTDYQL